MTPDIVFVNLPSPYLEDAMWIYPLGLVCLATYARNKGVQAEILDLAGLRDCSYTNMVHELRKVRAPVLGISVVTPTARFLPLAFAASRFDQKKLVAGGPHASSYPVEILDLGFSSVVVGEGESCVQVIVEPKQGGILHGEAMELDSLPLPDRSLVSGYKGPTPVMTSRSCPYRCAFCSTSEAPYRQRSPENVVEEIQTLKADQIIFYDDTLTMKRSWVEKLCDLILARRIKKNFRCSTRADRVDFDLLSLMKAAGFEEICVGVESGSQKILDILNKKTKVEDNTRARRLAEKAGVKFKAYIMIGCPGETFETLQETKMWLETVKPDSVGLYIFHPLPGSDIWKHPEKYDIMFKKDYDSTYYGGRRNEMVSGVSTSGMTKQDITKFYWEML